MKHFYTAFLFTFLLVVSSIAQDALQGYISDPFTQQGLAERKMTLNLYDPNNGTFLGTIGPVWTDINGYYDFGNVTEVENNFNTSAQSVISYSGNTIWTNNNDEKTLYIYSIIGEEVFRIKTFERIIKLNMNQLPSGRFVTLLRMGKNSYSNLIINNNGIIIANKKLEEKLNREKSFLNKPTEIGATIKIIDSTNAHHSYIDGGIGNWSGSRELNITLPPVITLQYPFSDSEIPYPVNNLMDLWKYMSRVQGPDDYRLYAKTLWPIKLYIDSANAPTDWITPIRNAINFKRNNTSLNPDSVLIETNEYTDPFSGQEYSAVFLIYTDSTDIGQQDSRIGFFFDGNSESFTGAYFKINTTTGMQSIDVYKLIQRELERYITQTGWPINNLNYMGTGTRGAPYETTPDEQLLEDMVRNMSPNIWINRFFNPGTLGKQSLNKGSLDYKQNILDRFKDDKSVKVIVK